MARRYWRSLGKTERMVAVSSGSKPSTGHCRPSSVARSRTAPIPCSNGSSGREKTAPSIYDEAIGNTRGDAPRMSIAAQAPSLKLRNAL